MPDDEREGVIEAGAPGFEDGATGPDVAEVPGASAGTRRPCPWCSAPLPADDLEVCPACGARIVAVSGAEVPGVTSVDVGALGRRPLSGSPPSLDGLLMGGAPTTRPSRAELGAIAPPDDRVREEILRLELEARRANLEAEAVAMEAEEALRRAEAAKPPADAPAGGHPDPSAGDPARPDGDV